MVRRAEDALFSIVAGLSSPSQNMELTLRTSVSFWSGTHISFHLVYMNQCLGQARRMPNLVTGRSYRAEVHWKAADLSTVPVNPFFLRPNCHLQHKSIVPLPLYFVFIIFDSFTFCLPFFLAYYFPFLIQHIYVCGKERISLYGWTDSPWAVLQHSIQIMLEQISEQGHLKCYKDQEGLW